VRILKLLEENKIEVVVDVRSVPYSQYSPQFNGQAFSLTLRGHGIEYIHAGRYLGGLV
jgi:uncharacterized protein (DUF488 family)